MGEEDVESSGCQEPEHGGEKPKDEAEKDLETTDDFDSDRISGKDAPIQQQDSSIKGESAINQRPSHFNCPLTGEIFKNPVVAPDGETYEKSAYLREHDIPQEGEMAESLYPNRALKIIMDDDNLAQSSSVQASFRKLRSSVKRALSEYLDDVPDDSTYRGISDAAFPLSDGYFCSITCNIMYEPVIDPDGNTFEKVAIENWIRIHGDSPVTRRKMAIESLYPNLFIQRLLEIEKNKPPDEIHPDILKWKDEPRPEATDAEYGGQVAALSPEQRLSAEQLRVHRRRLARRQLLHNLLGLIVCLMLLRFVRT